MTTQAQTQPGAATNAKTGAETEKKKDGRGSLKQKNQKNTVDWRPGEI